MARHKEDTKRSEGKTQSDLIKDAAKEREAEMQPSPVVNTRIGEDRPAEFQSTVDADYRARYEASEKQKEEDIKRLEKDSDGKPKA